MQVKLVHYSIDLCLPLVCFQYVDLAAYQRLQAHCFVKRLTWSRVVHSFLFSLILSHDYLLRSTLFLSFCWLIWSRGHPLLLFLAFLLEDVKVLKEDPNIHRRQIPVHARVQALKQTDESLDAGRLGLLLSLLHPDFCLLRS